MPTGGTPARVIDYATHPLVRRLHEHRFVLAPCLVDKDQQRFEAAVRRELSGDLDQ